MVVVVVLARMNSISLDLVPSPELVLSLDNDLEQG